MSKTKVLTRAGAVCTGVALLSVAGWVPLAQAAGWTIAAQTLTRTNTPYEAGIGCDGYLAWEKNGDASYIDLYVEGQSASIAGSASAFTLANAGAPGACGGWTGTAVCSATPYVAWRSMQFQVATITGSINMAGHLSSFGEVVQDLSFGITGGSSQMFYNFAGQAGYDPGLTASGSITIGGGVTNADLGTYYVTGQTKNIVLLNTWAETGSWGVTADYAIGWTGTYVTGLTRNVVFTGTMGVDTATDIFALANETDNGNVRSESLAVINEGSGMAMSFTSK